MPWCSCKQFCLWQAWCDHVHMLVKKSFQSSWAQARKMVKKWNEHAHDGETFQFCVFILNGIWAALLEEDWQPSWFMPAWRCSTMITFWKSLVVDISLTMQACKQHLTSWLNKTNWSITMKHTPKLFWAYQVYFFPVANPTGYIQMYSHKIDCLKTQTRKFGSSTRVFGAVRTVPNTRHFDGLLPLNSTQLSVVQVKGWDIDSWGAAIQSSSTSGGLAEAARSPSTDRDRKNNERVNGRREVTSSISSGEYESL